MIAFSGVIETATGELLRAGYCDFSADGSFDGGTEAIRTDVPYPPKVRREGVAGNMDKWDGAAWVEVAQPPAP